MYERRGRVGADDLHGKLYIYLNRQLEDQHNSLSGRDLSALCHSSVLLTLRASSS